MAIEFKLWHEREPRSDKDNVELPAWINDELVAVVINGEVCDLVGIRNDRMRCLVSPKKRNRNFYIWGRDIVEDPDKFKAWEDPFTAMINSVED